MSIFGTTAFARPLAISALATISSLLAAIATPLAHGDVLIDSSTPGYSNDQIGGVLNGTSKLFPHPPDCQPDGDLTSIDPAPEPDLGLAAAILGDWLMDPFTLNENWFGPAPIASTWTLCDENAVVYLLELPAPRNDVKINIGVDNGTFVWLDGVYLGGEVMPGLVVPGELVLEAGDLRAGTYAIQILREDHGQLNGFFIRVTGCPLAGQPGDIDGNCRVDGGDVGILLGAWGPCPAEGAGGGPCAADLNTDGVVNGADLGIVLAGWTG